MQFEPIVRDLESATYDDVIEPGADYVLDLLLLDGQASVVNLSNVVAAYTVKPRFTSATTYFGYVSGIDPNCVIDAPNGRLVVRIPAADTSVLKFRMAVYDIFLTDTVAHQTIRLVKGSLRAPVSSKGGVV